MSEKFRNKYRIPTARLPNRDYGANGTYFITICTHQRIPYFGEIRRDAKYCVSPENENDSRRDAKYCVSTPGNDGHERDAKYCVSTGGNVMRYTPLGEMAIQCALDIPKHFPFVRVDEFVVMPNHVHLLFTIDKPENFIRQNKTKCESNVETQNVASPAETNNQSNVETQNVASPPELNRESNVETQNIASLSKMESTNIETQNVASLQGNQFGPQSMNVASVVRGYKIGVTKFARQNGVDFRWQERFHDHIVRKGVDYETIRAYIVYNVDTWESDTLNQ